jgi:hypothetical protein
MDKIMKKVLVSFLIDRVAMVIFEWKNKVGELLHYLFDKYFNIR